MQDFTKQNNLQIPTQSQQPKWLSNDRFWNLFFWLFMSTGFSIAGLLKHQLDASLLVASLLGGFLMLCTLATTGVLLNTFNAPSKKHFRALSKSSLAGFILFITLAASIFVISCVLTDKATPSISFFITFRAFFIIFAPLSLLFIYLNCPISILFTRRVWRSKPMSYSKTGFHSSSNRNYNSAYKRNNSSDHIYNPGYSSLSVNIHNRHRR